MERIDKKEHKTADHRADDGAEVGDEIGYGDDDRYKADILHAADEHKDRVHDADDQGIKQALDKKTDENGVAAQRKIHDSHGGILAEKRPHQTPPPSQDPFFVHEEIDGKNQGDHDRDDISARIGRTAQDSSRVFPHKAYDAAQSVLRQGREPVRIEEALQEAALQHPDRGGGVIVDVLREGGNTRHQLRNQRPNQEKQHQKRRHHSQHNRQRPAPRSGLHLLQQLVGKQVRQRIQHVRKDDSQKNHLEVSEESAHGGHHRTEVGQQHIERHADTGNDRAVIPLFL